tara:strand:- start:539 stop:1255 length:717 start_codon:yes stop_codon:yes gene_type:complete
MPNDELIDFRGVQHFQSLQVVAAVMGSARKSVDARIEELMAYYNDRYPADPVGEMVAEDICGNEGYAEVPPPANTFRYKKGYRLTLFPIPGTKSIALMEVHAGRHGRQYEMDHQVALTTGETSLPMIVDEWPEPKAVVDTQAVWQRHMKGIKVNPEEVFYLISPGETSLIQGLKWITVGGWPMLTGYKKITLFQWKKDPTYDDRFLVFVHETLAQLPELQDPQHRSGSEGPAALPVQG